LILPDLIFVAAQSKTHSRGPVRQADFLEFCALTAPARCLADRSNGRIVFGVSISMPGLRIRIFGQGGDFMYAKMIVVALLLANAACAPRSVVRSTPPLSALGFQPFALEPAVFESDDPNPGRLCQVGTKDCMTPREMYGGLCFLSTGRCKADGHLQYVSAVERLQLEAPVAGGGNPEIILPVER
jgi:hypothetical protein